MHSTIIKLSTKSNDSSLNDMSINTSSYEYFGIDYCGDEVDDDQVFGVLESMLKGVVEINREKRTIHLLDNADVVVEQVMNDVREKIAQINPYDLAIDKNCCRQEAIDSLRRFRNFSTLFYVDGSLMYSMDFVSDFLNGYHGKTMYVINGIDYHW